MIVAHFTALLAVTFGVFGAVELNRFESVSACTPISVDWRGGESGSELVSVVRGARVVLKVISL